MKVFKLWLITLAAVLTGCWACVEKDYALGGSLIPTDQLFDIYSVEFDLEEVDLRMTDSLSGYSSRKIAVGAVRDEDFGLSTRSSVVTLVPVYDSLDWGRNARLNHFHFTSVADSCSVYDETQSRILQNINVYEMNAPLDSLSDINADLSAFKGGRATNGPIIFNGSDSLAFDFSEAFARKYMETLMADPDLSRDLNAYLKKLPGIYVECEEPLGLGGRVNLFELQLKYNTSYVITGNYAELCFSAEYEGVRKDTSFLFWFSPTGHYNVDSLVTNTKQGYLPQYCFNHTEHSSRAMSGPAGAVMRIQGGGGLKPVVSADYLRDLMRTEISKHCSDPSKVVVNKAGIVLPYKYEYKDMYKYPQILSPTCRIKTGGVVTFAGISDASDENEDPGKMNRSLMQYAPDITYHAQSILQVADDVDISNYDIWFLMMANEKYTSTTSGSSSNEMSDYYKYLMYNQYYNNVYGGYGGYGYGGYGYGSYGYDSYSNYYSYYLMSMMASSSSSKSSTISIVELDTSRYYNAVLYGPSAEAGRRPKFRFTYSVPKNLE